MTIRLVTDSSSQLPPELQERLGVSVVPILVSVNGVEHREGVDLDADGFWAHWTDGTPEISTSQPSPGVFAVEYQRLVAEGATEIVSVHVGSDFSGTLNSARLGAEAVDVPVHLVDTGTLSFGISCCVWEAAVALSEGASAAKAAAVAGDVAGRVASVFVLQALDFTRGQGRMVDQLPPSADAISVLAMTGADTEVVGESRSVEELSRMMVDTMAAAGRPIRAALCIADAGAAPFYDAMEAQLASRPEVVDLVRYRVGPSIGAYTGPGTAGGYWYEL